MVIILEDVFWYPIHHYDVSMWLHENDEIEMKFSLNKNEIHLVKVWLFFQALKIYNKKYSLAELQQNPPPEGVDPCHKEVRKNRYDTIA